MSKSKVFRSTSDYLIAGVCGGLAKYFGFDATLIRIVFIILSIWGGSGLLIYLIFWAIIPKEEGGEFEDDREERIKSFAAEIKEKGKGLAQEVRRDEGRNKGQGRVFLGAILLLVGLSSIWNEIMPNTIRWEFFWPGIVTLMGLYLILKK